MIVYKLNRTLIKTNLMDTADRPIREGVSYAKQIYSID